MPPPPEDEFWPEEGMGRVLNRINEMVAQFGHWRAILSFSQNQLEIMKNAYILA